MEDTYVEEQSPKKTKFIIIAIIIVLVVCGILFFIYQKNNTLHIKNKVTYEAGDLVKINLKDYVTSKIVDESDYTLDISNVPMDSKGKASTVGKYEYTVKYKGIEKKGTIIIKDTTNPEVEVSDLTIGVNDELVLDEFVTVCNDYSKPCNVTYNNESDEVDTFKEGTYNFKIKITDTQGNSVTKDVKLTVSSSASKESNMASDLNIAYISPEYDDYDNSFLLKYDAAIEEDELFGDALFEELFDIAGSDLHSYIPELYANNLITDSDVIYIYNKYGYVIGFSIRVKLDNGKVFYITK